MTTERDPTLPSVARTDRGESADGQQGLRSGWRQGVRPETPAPIRAVRRAGVAAFASPHTRRLFPARLSFPLIEAYAAVTQRLSTFHWRENERFYRELLKYTPLAGTEADVARRAVAEFFHSCEVFWRPWLMSRGEIDGIEYFQAARSEGRGVVGVFPHFGMPYAQFPIMRRYGIDAWVIASPHHYVEMGNGHEGRFARQGKKYVDLLGEGRAIVRAGPDVPTEEGAFAVSLRRLRERATVCIAFDSVGSLPTPFMGRRIMLASGPAKLAFASEAIVAPFVHRLRGHLPVVKFGPALDPRYYDSPEALQAAIAGVMNEWALERPESVWPLEVQPGGPPLVNGPPLDPSAAAA
jgi:lauroyl/myristoyl acyltransferase